MQTAFDAKSEEKKHGAQSALDHSSESELQGESRSEQLGAAAGLPSFLRGPVQAKLIVGAPDDSLEKEADSKDKIHQCPDDAGLDAKYYEWLHYPAEKDAEEQALVLRINSEIFGPLNQERNNMFYSDKPEDREKRKELGVTGVTYPVGRLSATGNIANTSFESRDPFDNAPRGTIWDNRGIEGNAADKSAFDKQDISGFAEFKDSKGQRIFVPQLGFGSKPSVMTIQIMCHMVPVVKPGVAKLRAGPTGESVTASSIADRIHGGNHFFWKGSKPIIIGAGEVKGQSAGPDEPVHWWHRNELPVNEDERGKIEKNMQKRADKIMATKLNRYENLKKYYLQRQIFIATYKSRLEPDPK